MLPRSRPISGARGTLANLRDRAGRLTGEERDQALHEQRSTELKLDIEAAKLAALRQAAPH